MNTGFKKINKCLFKKIDLLAFCSKIYLGAVYLFLYAPIIVLMLFSFSRSRSRANFGILTLDWYRSLFLNQELMSSLYNTFVIAILATTISVIIGTLASIGIYFLPRYMQTIVMRITYLPMLNPDIVTGISLMLLFIFCKINMGFLTLILSHVTFCVPYVILAIQPKLKRIGRTSFEAAEDLGASDFYILKKVIIPQIYPEILNGTLLSFTLSLDDFIVSFFNNGYVNTLSISIYSQTKQGINPEINALSTIVFIVLMLLLFIIDYRRKIGEK